MFRRGNDRRRILPVAGRRCYLAGATGATGEDKFASGIWQQDAHGLPVLSGALLSFSCAVTEAVEAGSHSVFIGRITDIRTSADRRALLYERSNFHRLEELGS